MLERLAAPRIPLVEALGQIGPSAPSHGNERTNMSQSDEMTALAQQRIEALLSSAYVEYSTPLHSYAYHLLGNQEDADDVVQEVFIRAHGHMAQLREQAHLKSWLYRIATNLCMDQLRRRTRIRKRFGFALSLGAESDDGEQSQMIDVAHPASLAALDGVAERDHIIGALRRMPPKYSSCLILYSAQGLSYREIAEILNITPGAAAVRLTRARDLFAKHYDALRGEEQR
jgi:RNA polymerase sigma-70 factor, ECF subfamily